MSHSTPPTPPAGRTHLGQQFTEANQNAGLVLQRCAHCSAVQYPPREICRECLLDQLEWQPVSTRGTLLTSVELHNSFHAFYQQHLPWPLASVKLEGGVVAYSHLASPGLKPGSDVNIFAHPDSSGQSVLVSVDTETPVDSAGQRSEIMTKLGLL